MFYSHEIQIFCTCKINQTMVINHLHYEHKIATVAKEKNISIIGLHNSIKDLDCDGFRTGYYALLP